MALLLGKLEAMCPKPMYLKHFIWEDLELEDLGVEVEGVSLEILFCGWVLLKIGRRVFILKFVFILPRCFVDVNIMSTFIKRVFI